MSCNTTKVTQLDFKIFKKEFEKYRQLFGLTGWDVGFKFEPLGEKLSQVIYVANDCVATVTLNSDPTPNVIAQMDGKGIMETAKHEAIHLLLARYDYIACARYVTESELYQANEEITVKLTDLIP